MVCQYNEIFSTLETLVDSSIWSLYLKSHLKKLLRKESTASQLAFFSEHKHRELQVCISQHIALKKLSTVDFWRWGQLIPETLSIYLIRL